MGADNLFNYMDPALVNVSIGYKNRSFFCENLAPPIPVDKPTGRVWLFGKEKFRRYETIRADKAEAREIADWALGNISYNTQDHGLKSALSDQQAAAADPGVDWDITTTENLTQSIIVDQEIQLMNAIINDTGPSAPPTAVPSTTLSGVNLWSDMVNSDPINAIEAQKTVILRRTGALPNTLAVGYPVHQVLRQHLKIIDRFKYTELPEGYASTGQLASVFGVKNYWVMDALYDTASEGGAPSPEFIWGKNALLGVVPEAPMRREVALCYTPWWTFARSDQGGLRPDLQGNKGVIVRRYRLEAKRCDVLEIDKWYDQVFGDSGAGFVWKSAVA
jgi:hypothetical protein